MNKPIRTMSIGCLLLFLALMLNVTYVQYVQAGSLQAEPGNIRVTMAEFSRERGAILVGRDPIAESKPIDDQFQFQREYPQGPKYSHITGYFNFFSNPNSNPTGIEQTQNDVLSGNDAGLQVNNLLDTLAGSEPQGGSVTLTLNDAAQTAAVNGLADLGSNVQGAVVALEPSTGRVLAMASSPNYDPNDLAGHDLAKVDENARALIADDAQPLLNRAISTTLPPGSTFKLVTAAAAIEKKGYTPDSLVPGGAALDLPQTSSDIHNESGGDCGGDRVTLTRAMEVSCNVAFGALGLELSADEMREQAERFGFGQTYLDDLPRQAESRFPAELNDPQRAQSAIGQFDVSATPLQMAMVAAGIANDGVVMKPYLVDEVRSPDFEVLDQRDPEELSRAVSTRTAEQLQQMMVSTVENGTGTNAIIPGVRVGGKTGTAQSTPDRPPYAWFVSFAGEGDNQVAVCVLVQSSDTDRSEIAGGRLGAPIAKRVMEAVVNQ